MKLLEAIKERAKGKKKVVIFPEGAEERIVAAAKILVAEKIVKPVLLGNENEIKRVCKRWGLASEKIIIIDPLRTDNFQKFAEEYYETKKERLVSFENAVEEVKKTVIFGAMLVKKGYGDGMVAGAVTQTANVIRAALRIVGLKKNVKILSSCFLMISPDKKIGEDGAIIFSDCGVNPEPTPESLVDIAFLAAELWENLAGTSPKVAFLSFSTKGSAAHKSVDKVRMAYELMMSKKPKFPVDGELQLDAAIVPSVAERKAIGTPLKGNANVLIFPDLNSGNIGYKIAERFGKARATGPLLVGLKKPVHDLSRGCSAEDIVNVAAVCAVQA